MNKLYILIISFLIISCSNSSDGSENQSQNQALAKSIKVGAEVFAKNCQICHGLQASGIVADWRKPLSDGSYPPPPLNGTAHAWHHSPKVLLDVINLGGSRVGGKMPGFENKLTEEEKQALLDYLYSLWPDAIQQKYDKRFKN